jgi:hypothetical protein
MEKINEDLKDKFNNLLSIKNTLQNDLLTLQSLLDQEKSTNNNLIERLNEIEGESLKSLKKPFQNYYFLKKINVRLH